MPTTLAEAPRHAGRFQHQGSGVSLLTRGNSRAGQRCVHTRAGKGSSPQAGAEGARLDGQQAIRPAAGGGPALSGRAGRGARMARQLDPAGLASRCGRPAVAATPQRNKG